MQMANVIDKAPDINNDNLPPLEIVRQMIEYETFLRLSEPIQELFDFYRNDDTAVT